MPSSIWLWQQRRRFSMAHGGEKLQEAKYKWLSGYNQSCKFRHISASCIIKLETLIHMHRWYTTYAHSLKRRWILLLTWMKNWERKCIAWVWGVHQHPLTLQWVTLCVMVPQCPMAPWIPQCPMIMNYRYLSPQYQNWTAPQGPMVPQTHCHQTLTLSLRDNFIYLFWWLLIFIHDLFWILIGFMFSSVIIIHLYY